MAFFDDNIFNPQTYAGGMSGWLADALRSGLLGGSLQNQPPMQPQTGPTFAQGDQGSMGGVPFPIFGQPDTTTDLSAQSRQQPAPMQQPPSALDRISAFTNNIHEGGLIPGLVGAFTGQRISTTKPTDDIREFEYAKSQGYKGTFADWFAHKRGGGGEYGLQPIYGKDAQGNTVLLQLGKGGTVIQSALPKDASGAPIKISEGIEKIDLGDKWGVYERKSGQIIGYQPKNLAGAAEQKAIGAGQGEAKERQTSLESKMPGLERVISQLDNLSEKATYTLGGQALDQAMRQLNMEPREASVARKEYEAVVNNQIIPLLRDTFGPQFTDREGIRLQKTLGDPDISPKEKQAVLRAFIDQKRRDVEALQRRNAGTSAPQQAAPQAAPRTAINPKTGQRIMLDPASNQWVPMR